MNLVPPVAAAVSAEAWVVLWDLLILLTAALALGTLAARLGQSVIVGYLISGAIVGPNALGWISTQQELFGIAEIGVALLLFAIGLEFSPRRLWSLGGIVLKVGLVQVTVTTLVGFAAAAACGLDVREALVVGMMVAVSSTACVLRLLTDRLEMDSQHGRTALGVLLVQDAAVIPMMLLVSVMSAGGSWGDIAVKLALSLLLAAGLLGLFWVVFNIAAPRMLHLPAWRTNRDLPALLAVVMATGSAWATHALGLSPALGAFAAGVLLAMSPFAAQIRADTRPLTTVLVTLFFATIGMFSDPVLLVENGLLVLAIAAVIVAAKTGIVAAAARCFGQPWPYAFAAGLCLAQAGEFSFVLAAIAQTRVGGVALMSPTVFRALVSATIVTLLLTPYLVQAAARVGTLGGRLGKRRRTSEPTDATPGDGEAWQTTEDAELVLIIGFGPSGQRVAEGLMGSHAHRIAAIDLNPKNIEVARRYGLESLVGDATRRDILEHAGVERARAVVVALPDEQATLRVIQLVRDLAPRVFLAARCRHHIRLLELSHAGADAVIDEEDQVGRSLTAEVQRALRGE